MKIGNFLFGFILLMWLAGCQAGSSSVNGLSLKPSDAANKAQVGSKLGNLKVVGDLPPPENVQQGIAQLIFENDLLEIDVFQVDDLDRTVRVDSRGRINLPLIGSVQAAGLSVPQLENSLKKRYGARYLQSPEITVLVKESSGQTITMDGEFKKTGVFPVTVQATLLRLVSQAGGISDLADENKLFVYRKYNTGTRVAQYSIAEIREGKRSDPKLHGGDVVVAFTSRSKVATRNLREALGLAVSATRVASPI